MSRRWRLAAVLVLWAVGGLLVVFLDALGLLIFAVLCVALVIVARRLLVARIPGRAREQMLAQLNPGAGPPAGAQPVHSALLDRFHEAGHARDWDAVKRLLAEDFVFVDGAGKCHAARGHPRSGPDFDGTAWSRLTVAEDGERVREIAHLGVIRVG